MLRHTLQMIVGRALDAAAGDVDGDGGAPHTPAPHGNGAGGGVVGSGVGSGVGNGAGSASRTWLSSASSIGTPVPTGRGASGSTDGTTPAGDAVMLPRGGELLESLQVPSVSMRWSC
jgi:hypothetical protein